eukprot:756571-Hanusia_phi.AAC.3
MTNNAQSSSAYQTSETSSSTSGLGSVAPNRGAAAPNGGVSNLSRNGIGITLTAHGSGNNSGGSSTTCNHNSSGGDSDEETRRIARREYHKKIERKRRDRMRSLYDELRQLTDAAELADKNGVLEGFILCSHYSCISHYLRCRSHCSDPRATAREHQTFEAQAGKQCTTPAVCFVSLTVHQDLRQENSRLANAPQAFAPSIIQMPTDKKTAGSPPIMRGSQGMNNGAVSGSPWNGEDQRVAKRAKISGL